MRVSVDASKCQGHARCAALCPEVFQLDELGYSTALAAEVPRVLEERARRAAGNCPEGAIEVAESRGSSA